MNKASENFSPIGWRFNQREPLVSVIIPCYNRGGIIEKAINSVKTQTYSNWECIIVDDFSTDNTFEVVEKLIENESRCTIIKNTGIKGASSARNTGLNTSRGDFITFLDSDDILDRESLAKRVELANIHPHFDFYCFPTLVFKNFPFDTVYLWNYLNKDEDDLLRFFRQDMPWCTHGVFWKRQFVVRLLGWDTSLFCWQDWDLHVRALSDKNVKYYKVADRIQNVDNFYNVNKSKCSISKGENEESHIHSKIAMLYKHINNHQIFESSDRKLEFSRLIFRISKQAVTGINFETGKIFFSQAMSQLGYSKIFIFFWVKYLKNLSAPTRPFEMRRLFNLFPAINVSKNLQKKSSTHLNAVCHESNSVKKSK